MKQLAAIILTILLICSFVSADEPFGEITSNLSYSKILDLCVHELSMRNYQIEYINKPAGVILAQTKNPYGEIRERQYMVKIDVTRMDKHQNQIAVLCLIMKRFNGIVRSDWSDALYDLECTRETTSQLRKILEANR